ncbi:hypothetical protein GALL_248530 [mine drainage metagenome]|uniref:Uncharacterized protein n=1 Tax=mine drainage metagenome TaxID=410659 RepID=A0A1J5RAZ3_9ZZZZ
MLVKELQYKCATQPVLHRNPAAGYIKNLTHFITFLLA